MAALARQVQILSSHVHKVPRPPLDPAFNRSPVFINDNTELSPGVYLGKAFIWHVRKYKQSRLVLWYCMQKHPTCIGIVTILS